MEDFLVRRGIDLYAKLEKEFHTFKRQVEVGEVGVGGRGLGGCPITQ